MVETLREMLRREPFQPFWIVMTSGDRLEVTDPQLVAIGKTQVFYCYPRSDRFAHLRLNQIVAFDTLQPSN